jgi:hypothetical protein
VVSALSLMFPILSLLSTTPVIDGRLHPTSPSPTSKVATGGRLEPDTHVLTFLNVAVAVLPPVEQAGLLEHHRHVRGQPHHARIRVDRPPKR